jgi:hypothetical protein
LAAEEFWEHLDRLQERARAARKPSESPLVPHHSPENPGWRQSPEESAFWVETFGGVLDAPDVQKALAPNTTLLTDAEIAEIQREIDREP